MAPTDRPAHQRAVRRARLLRAGAVLAVAATLLAWWLTGSDGAPEPRGTVGFSTGVPYGVYDRYGSMLSEAVRTALPGLRLRLDPSAGSVENLERVDSGRDAFAIAAADAVADYPGRSRLRAIARLYDDYLQLIVPDDSPVRTIKDLRGLRVGVGRDKSGVNLVAGRLLRAAGLDPGRDIRPVHLGITESGEALRQGRIDAFFWSGGLPTTAVTRLSEEFARAHSAIRLVPLGDLAAPLRRLGGDSGGAEPYRSAVMPADAYPAARPRGAAVRTIAIANLLVTRQDTDVGLVEAMTRVVIGSRDAIGARVHAAQLVDLRTAIYTDPLPLHEGARRYYRSVKP